MSGYVPPRLYMAEEALPKEIAFEPRHLGMKPIAPHLFVQIL
jgi:hypothetical protein